MVYLASMNNAVQISYIIKGALAGDTDKVLAYAKLIADQYDKDGNARSARIIRRAYGAEPDGAPVELDTQ